MSAQELLAQCLAGRISPPVLFARLVLNGMSDADIERLLANTADLRTLFGARITDLRRMRAMLAQVDHAGSATPDDIARQFDRAVTCAPEASVAAYSLGDPDLLRAATAEIVDWLRREDLLRPGATILDLGCGFGRVAEQLAPDAGFVLGLDISTAMIAEARRRHHGLPRVQFACASGADLLTLGTCRFDLVLAVDVFPYLFQAGPAIVRQHLADIAHALKPGGALVILNLAYAQAIASQQQALHWAAETGLHLARSPSAPFTVWDGTAFVFRTADTLR